MASTTSGAEAIPELPRIGDPLPVVLYFTASGDLSFDLPAPGSVAIGTPAQQLATGVSAREFSLPRQPQALLIGPEDVRLVAHVSSALPQWSNTAFDLGIWFGSDLASGLGALAVGAPVHAPGTPQEFDVDLAFGTRKPLLIPEGSQVIARLAGQFGGESGEPHLLVGGETASRLELTIRNFTVDPLAGVVSVDPMVLQAEVTNPYFLPSCGAIEGAVVETPVAILPNAQSLSVRLEARGTHAPQADIDLFLLDGSLVIAEGTTPFATESVFLADETLLEQQGKTLTARVVGCGPGPVPYELVAEQTTLTLPT